MGNYGYQYETSPRKLKPDYNEKVKTKQNKKTKYKKNNNKKSKKDSKQQFKSKIGLMFKFMFIFVILFFIILRNSQINESFAQIQNLKTKITSIQKENDQLEISIQNSLNLNNIEQAAKELLGMQKLTNKQTVYVSLSKKDYIEPKSEEVIINKDKNFFISIIEKVENIF